MTSDESAVVSDQLPLVATLPRYSLFIRHSSFVICTIRSQFGLSAACRCSRYKQISTRKRYPKPLVPLRGGRFLSALCLRREDEPRLRWLRRSHKICLYSCRASP